MGTAALRSGGVGGRRALSERWYRNAVIYSVDARTFQDSDDDGVGDLRGLDVVPAVSPRAGMQRVQPDGRDTQPTQVVDRAHQ
jgi:hypothetical protein